MEAMWRGRGVDGTGEEGECEEWDEREEGGWSWSWRWSWHGEEWSFFGGFVKDLR